MVQYGMVWYFVLLSYVAACLAAYLELVRLNLLSLLGTKCLCSVAVADVVVVVGIDPCLPDDLLCFVVVNYIMLRCIVLYCVPGN
jgi:hypothetical protein